MRSYGNAWKRCFLGTQPYQRYWLTLPGSLTTALKALGQFRLQQVHEGKQRLWGDEAAALHIHPGTEAWIREIIMSIGGIPCVAARSFTTLTASRSAWKGLRTLGTRPLGEYLYHEGDLCRSPFEWSLCNEESPIGQLAHVLLDNTCKSGNEATPEHIGNAYPVNTQDMDIPTATAPTKPFPLLARRSFFFRRKTHREHGTLVINECFLPGFWHYAQNKPRLALIPRWSPAERHLVAQQKRL